MNKESSCFGWLDIETSNKVVVLVGLEQSLS